MWAWVEITGMQDRMSQYVRRYGKLTEKTFVTIDSDIKRVEEEAKSLGIDWNAWARDLIADHLEDMRACIAQKRGAGLSGIA